jgi:hypothetical protein
MTALKKASKVNIEIGSIEAAGAKIIVMAEVRKGLITKITPVGCDTCMKSGSLKKREVKKAALEALKKARGLGKPTVKLPVPIARVRTIKIGPIVIIVNGGIDVCLIIYGPFGMWCLFCWYGGSHCEGPFGEPAPF